MNSSVAPGGIWQSRLAGLPGVIFLCLDSLPAQAMCTDQRVGMHESALRAVACCLDVCGLTGLLAQLGVSGAAV